MELFLAHQINGDTITLDPEESRHAVKVLRLRLGDQIHITDGNGKLYEALVSIPDHKELSAKIETIKVFRKREYRIHIAIAPTKNIDRFEWFLEKATEAGIDEVTPIVCRHSERTVIKSERLEKILVSAMKQSNQFYLPKLNSLSGFKDILESGNADTKFIAHCYEEQKNPLSHQPIAGKSVIVLIGPEGDFSPEEVKAAIDNGYQPVSLGATRLRTETAGLAAVQTIHFINEVTGKD